ncbi:MAG: DUF4139 domain-containing protein [Gammaproteobacteria bacterium]|nr:DUF4139 domain-containing protein [Gammaproteobacteria bacterium]
MPRIATVFLMMLMTIPASALHAEELKSTADDQQVLNLTIYNAGRALIRDQRKINSTQSYKQIAFMDVARTIIPQTVAIKGLDVLEQNYDYDLLSPQALIQKNIGRTVQLARRSNETGETLQWTQGTILSNNGGVILEMEDGSLESLNNNLNYDMVFAEVPNNLRVSPTLSLLLNKPTPINPTVEMTYLADGMSWQSDYIMQLNPTGDKASLDSWITLNNQSGIGYQDANLQLLAGDINIHQPEALPRMAMMMRAEKADSGVTEEALSGYHLYSIPHKTTINNNQSKQIKLFSAIDIPVNKTLRDKAHVDHRGAATQKSKPEQILAFTNTQPSLGLPLPKGILRVYTEDQQGYPQFIGEDGINHTAVNDALEITLGKVFDISLERKSTKLQKISKKQTRLSREILINNGSEMEQTIEVSEIMPTTTWDIQQSSWSYQRQSPREAEFKVKVPPLKKLTLTYSVLLTYP